MTHTLFLALAMLFGMLVHAEDFQKSFSKNYTVNADAQVLIENQYGNVAIEVWDKNQVEILVTVKVANATENRTIEILMNTIT